MSLLAGFDIVTEISREAVLRLITEFKIGGVYLAPPFEMFIPISGVGLTGNIHLMVDDLLLNLNPESPATGPTVSLTFNFSDTSLLAQIPNLTITGLDGGIRITSPLALVPSSQHKVVPSVRLSETTVAPGIFSQAAKAKLSNAFSGFGVTAEEIDIIAETQMQQFVRQAGDKAMELSFTVIPGTDGSLSPPQYESLELHCISHDVMNQALGLFGILLAANHGHGDAAQKTVPAISSGDNMCVSIAPGAFHSLIFCPALARRLLKPNGKLSDLPTSCGSANGLQTKGALLTKLADSFASGHINLDGTAQKSFFCFDATSTFHGEMTFAVSGTVLTPSVTMGPPNVDVGSPLYCGPAGGIAIGLTALISSEIIKNIAQGIAQDAAASAVDSILSTPLSSQNIGSSITGVNFDQVAITGEGITLSGEATIWRGAPGVKGISLIGSVTTSTKPVLSSGNYLAILPLCPPKEFPYTELAQQQTATYQALPTLLGSPVSLEWWISDGPNTIKLSGNSGTVSFDTQTEYALPLPGGTFVDQTVHISYVKSGDTIQLNNIPSEGNYLVFLRAKATDPIGREAQMFPPGEFVFFEGNVVTLGGGYDEYAAKCNARYGEFLRTHRPHADLTFTPWVPVDFPAPEQLLSYISTILASDDPRADDALVQAKLAHGGSFFRAVRLAASKGIQLAGAAQLESLRGRNL